MHAYTKLTEQPQGQFVLLLQILSSQVSMCVQNYHAFAQLQFAVTQAQGHGKPTAEASKQPVCTASL